MTRRFAPIFLIIALFVSGCREDKPVPKLSAEDNALLAEKADEKIGIIIRENLPSLFAGVVVFRSDAFLTESHRLDQAGISVLNMFGNTTILLLNSPDIPLLLKEPTVKKMYYLCRQGALARFHPAFEMEMLRRFGEGKGDEPISFGIRFLTLPEENDDKAVGAAGFAVLNREGYVWHVKGPLRYLSRLLEMDRIIFYE